MSIENLPPLENVINPKSLERQIKLIEQRLFELQTETNELEKRREACHILLGVPLVPFGSHVAAASAPVVPAKKSSRPKKKDHNEEEADRENTESELSEEVSVIRASELHA